MVAVGPVVGVEAGPALVHGVVGAELESRPEHLEGVADVGLLHAHLQPARAQASGVDGHVHRHELRHGGAVGDGEGEVGQVDVTGDSDGYGGAST